MIVLVLIVVIRIMTSGTMGITSRHRQADTKSQILEKADLGKKERTLSKRIFVSKLIKYTASHLHQIRYLTRLVVDSDKPESYGVVVLAPKISDSS